MFGPRKEQQYNAPDRWHQAIRAQPGENTRNNVWVTNSFEIAGTGYSCSVLSIPKGKDQAGLKPGLCLVTTVPAKDASTGRFTEYHLQLAGTEVMNMLMQQGSTNIISDLPPEVSESLQLPASTFVDIGNNIMLEMVPDKTMHGCVLYYIRQRSTEDAARSLRDAFDLPGSEKSDPFRDWGN